MHFNRYVDSQKTYIKESLKVFISGLLFCSIMPIGNAQIKVKASVFIENKTYFSPDYEIIPFNKKLIVIENQSPNYKKFGDYKILWMDSLLHINKEIYWKINKNFIWNAYDYQGEYLYLLTQHTYKQHLYKINKININTKRFENYDLALPLDITFKDIYVVDGKLFIWGELLNTSVIFNINLEKNTRIALKNISHKDIFVSEIFADKIKKRFYIIISNKQKISKLIIYSSDGVQIKIQEIKSDKNIISSKVMRHGNEIFLSGTYTERNTKLVQGIYFAKIDEKNRFYIKYISFLNLKNFFVFFGKRRKEKFRNRQAKRNLLGKINRFSFYTYLSDFSYQNNQFHLIGECYFLKRGDNRPNADYGQFSANPYANSPHYIPELNPIYVYNHAFSFSFDNNLEIKNDFSIKLDRETSENLEQHSYLDVDEDKSMFLKLYKGKLLYRTQQLIFPNQGENTKNVVEIDYEEKSFILKNKKNKFEALIHWYDDYFLLFGKDLQVENANGKKERKTGFYKILCD